MEEPIISVSGLRGVVGESLSPEIAIRYAAAFAAGLNDGPILISRDGRTTGPMLANALCSGLNAVGREVLDAGIAATPTTGVLVRAHQAAGGIQISASHNPPQYNGLKLLSAAGRVISAVDGERVIQRYHNETPHWAKYSQIGRVTKIDDTTSAHWQLIEPIIDVQRIRTRRFKVLLDANHGSGSVLGGRVLEELGCEFEIIGGDADGRFEHPPEPTAENLSSVLSRVTQSGADIGFCQDPDADRLAIIDESGRYVGEEYTLALCVDHVLRQKKGPVVTNCSTSRMSQDIADHYAASFHHSPVGEANVCDLMIESKAVIGGEGNGGVIDPRVGYVRDSFVGMALVLDAMAAREIPISALVDELPRYAMVKTKVPVEHKRFADALVALEFHFADAKASRMDGLRLDWPGKWLLIRASNTEPIVRIIAEAETESAATRLCEESAAVVGQQSA